MDNPHDFSHVTDDAAVEAPPKVSGDERRMHVRAYNYWLSLLDGKDFPSVEDLDPESLSDFGPHSVLLDFTNGSENPAIVYIGDKLRFECDLDHDINHITDVPPRTLMSRLTDHYMQIIANRAPVGFEAEFTNQRGLDMAYRGILLPFSSDNDTIDFIYGVINWKQIVVGALADSLQSEVDRVLAETPIPRLPQVSAWADGPSRTAQEPVVTPPSLGIDHPVLDEDVLHEEPHLTPAPDDMLADWLVAAREAAEFARRVDSRSRTALYRAIGLAYDFALIAEARPADYGALLADSNLPSQTRAPMTPIVKLVFGAGYDKTRLTEYAAVLGYAKSLGLQPGALAAYIESSDGGLKAVVKAARAAKRPVKMAVPRCTDVRERARALEPQVLLMMPGEQEFVVLVARRIDHEHIGVIGMAAFDEAQVERTLNRLAL